MAFATAALCNIAGRLVSYLLWSSFCGPVFPPKRQSGAERELQPWDGALRTLAQLSVDAPMMSLEQKHAVSNRQTQVQLLQ